MNMLLETIHDTGIVPVIAIEDAKKAVPLARALAKGGLCVAEVTFRTDAAAEAIKSIVSEVPEMTVGAGTVLDPQTADTAIAAGAKFIVSPGFNPATTRHVIDKGVCMIPGTATAGEMEQAMMMGLDVVKFFPAEQNGGLGKLKALAGPYRTLRWMPTGGINTDNIADYMGFDRVIACGGTWMVKKDLIENEKWDDITDICKKAVRKMLGFRLRHVGINCADEKDAVQTAHMLCSLFGFEYKPRSGSVFAGEGFEMLKGAGPGSKGHLAIETPDVNRAVYHLKREGASFDENTRETDGKGTRVIYLNGEIGGFAIHLVRK